MGQVLKGTAHGKFYLPFSFKYFGVCYIVRTLFSKQVTTFLCIQVACSIDHIAGGVNTMAS
jgi:hypothetical protein